MDTSNGLAAKLITWVLADVPAATPLTWLIATSMSLPVAVKPGTPTMATSARLACKATQLRGWLSAFS